jgi:hypothetical protein
MKSIKTQEITDLDLFYMINAGKELEKNLMSSSDKLSNKQLNKNNIDDNKNKNLEKEVKKLKNSLEFFEEKFGYISPYHDDIINKKKEKKVIQSLTLDISQKIYELYENKYYNDCYDLWNIYGFKPLLHLSPEENYEILRHLTKIKDDLYRRKYILKNLDNFNVFNDYNCYFETGISFRNIKDKENKDLNPKENYNNNSAYFQSSNNNNNINNNNINYDRMSNENIVNQKMNKNNEILEDIKKQVLNFSNN